MKLESSKIHLKIKDDGKGFDPSMEGTGNGLLSMRKRDEMLKGTLEIDSAQGTGSVITLRFPA